MRRLGLDFEQSPADIDERARAGETPVALAQRLAREKACVVAERYPDAIVIGSDQVAVFEGEATGKPGTAESARAHLARFSGGTVTFLTAVCVIGPGGEKDRFLDETEVAFRELGEDEIARYVAADDPVQCAGSFKVESLGPTLFRFVRSDDPTALQGLPLIRLATALRRLGLALP